MFARSVSIRLKPDSGAEFNRAIENEILPLLNGLAEQGYRLVAMGPAAILKLEPPASGHYQYDLVAHQRDPDKFFKALNEQGEQGYRWVPFSPLTEKSPQATKYRYLKAPHGQFGPAKAPAISSAEAEGFRPVSVVYFEQIIMGQFELVMERAHLEDALARELEADDLCDHGKRFDDEDETDERKQE